MSVTDGELSVREQIAVAELMDGKTAKEALTAAGYSVSTCNTGHYNVLSKPRIQNALREALEKAGVTVSKIAQVAADGMDANRPVVCDKSIVDYPDHGTRHRFMETVIKLSGLEPAQDVSIDAESYESRIMAIAAQSQAIDLPSIVVPCQNSKTIITEATVISERDDKCNDDYSTSDSDCGGGI